MFFKYEYTFFCDFLMIMAETHDGVEKTVLYVACVVIKQLLNTVSDDLYAGRCHDQLPVL